ncbi:hypothetical protein HMPREF0198_1461, partial [Cardiobacterium hominis ATCC 15826]
SNVCPRGRGAYLLKCKHALTLPHRGRGYIGGLLALVTIRDAKRVAFPRFCTAYEKGKCRRWAAFLWDAGVEGDAAVGAFGAEVA